MFFHLDVNKFTKERITRTVELLCVQYIAILMTQIILANKTRNHYFQGKKEIIPLSLEINSGLSSSVSSPGWGHYVVFLGKTIYSHRASLCPGV